MQLKLKYRLFGIGSGFCQIIDGLVLVFTLGYIRHPGVNMRFSVWYLYGGKR